MNWTSLILTFGRGFAWASVVAGLTLLVAFTIYLIEEGNKLVKVVVSTLGFLALCFLLGALTGCGVTIEPKPVKVEPITVNHQFHLSDINDYFDELCKTLDSSDQCFNVDYTACGACLTGDFLRRFK